MTNSEYIGKEFTAVATRMGMPAKQAQEIAPFMSDNVQAGIHGLSMSDVITLLLTVNASLNERIAQLEEALRRP
ncbi:MAG TPA: hypothetical protein VK141_08965 [Nitrosomonas sp.]|nr:hypothetical protein [Nitrosomonas sp.]